MHVLFLHSYYCTDKSTSGSRSHDLCKALITKGHSVTVVCQVVDLNRAMFDNTLGFIKKINCDGITIYGINILYSNKMGVTRRMVSFFLFMFAACFKCLSLRNIDLVFATSTPPTIAVPALFYKFLKRKPFIFELRDIWPDFVEQLDVLPNVPKWIFRFIDRCMVLIYRIADVVTTTTPGMTEIIANKGIAREKLTTILLGAKLDMYAKQCRPHPILNEPLLQGKFIVAFLGSISHGYGLTRLLDVAAEMSLVNPNIAFLILGRGSHVQFLTERIISLGLNNVYLGGSVPYSQVPSVLKHVHIGYESSIPSTASDCALDNKFYDYISAGLPILSNYDGDMGTLLREYNCGQVCADVMEEIQFLDLMEKNPSERQSMSANAIKLAEKFSRDTQKELFIALIDKTASLYAIR